MTTPNFSHLGALAKGPTRGLVLVTLLGVLSAGAGDMGCGPPVRDARLPPPKYEPRPQVPWSQPVAEDPLDEALLEPVDVAQPGLHDDAPAVAPEPAVDAGGGSSVDDPPPRQGPASAVAPPS